LIVLHRICARKEPGEEGIEKLSRVDFQRSLQQYPNCLQDGRILMEFFIKHHRDKNLDVCNRRYRLEYHNTNSQKFLSTDYHILQPSQYSKNTDPLNDDEEDTDESDLVAILSAENPSRYHSASKVAILSAENPKSLSRRIQSRCT
jgi:hypothetical protein